MEQPNYFGVLPAKVRYDDNLNSNAKLLFCELTALSNKEGYCFATNSYFAKLYKCSTRSISAWFSELQKYGYIHIEIIKEKGTFRKIYPLMDSAGVGMTVPTGTNEISNGGTNEISNGYEQPFHTKEYKENNNTSFNNNKEESEKQVFTPSPETKGTKPKRKKKPELNKIYPASFTPKVISLLEEYIEMRKQIGKALKSQIAFTRLCNECEKILTDYGQAVLENSIEISIASQWQSIYPKQLTKTINNGKTTNGINTKRQETIDWLNECYLDPNSL